MRLGFAVLGAAAVVGAYTLVNTLVHRPAAPGASAAETRRSWMPGVIEDEGEAEAETRSFELIRYLNPDGSFGMVDDARRVPPGAKILSRERRTASVAKAAETAPEPGPAALATPGRTLSPAEQRVLQRVLETGVSPDASQLERMQGDVDALERERGEQP